MARPRKPHRLRALEGGRGKSRKLTPDLPTPSSPLEPHKGLSKAELAEWKAHAAYIRELGLESRVDSAFVEGMVRFLCRARQADAALVKAKRLTMVGAKGGEVRRPEIQISRDCWKSYERMAGACGISAAARARLGATSRPPERAGDVPPELRNAKRR